MEENILNKEFDLFLESEDKKTNFEPTILSGRTFQKFEKVKEWQSKHGYTFNIYGNDHLIEGKKHFHFDHNGDNIHLKISFEGEIFEKKYLKPNILKDLIIFIQQEKVQLKLNQMWDEKNPII